MESIYQFIVDLFVGDGVIIAVAAYIIGAIIKTSIDKLPNKYIPLICGIIGIILGIVIPGIFPGRDIISSGICGLALSWAATGGYETIKNIFSKSEVD